MFASHFPSALPHEHEGALRSSDSDSIWRIDSKRNVTTVITDAGRTAEADGKKPGQTPPAALWARPGAVVKPER